MTEKYTAFYICHVCGEHQFDVRHREPGEDIVSWIEGAVRPALAQAHQRQSPWCAAEKCDLKLPMPAGTKVIGARVVS